MLRVNQLNGFGAGGVSGDITLGASGSAGSISALTTYTFTNCDIGAEAADRFVIVGIGATDSALDFYATSVTINGVAAFRNADWWGANSGFMYYNIAIFCALVPTGSSVSIVVTNAEAIMGCDIAWVAAYGLASPADYDSDAQGATTTNLGTSTTNSVDTIPDGLLVSFMYSATPTWDNGIITVADGNVYDFVFLGAKLKPTVASPLTITATHASDRRLMASAVYRKKSLPTNITVDEANKGNAWSSSALTTYTFSNCAIGPANADRWIVVGIVTEDSPDGSFGVNSVTIGGVSATEAADYGGAYASWGDSVAIYVAKVPTGTTANIVVTHSETVNTCDIMWVPVFGLTDGAPVFSGEAHRGSDGGQTMNTTANSIIFMVTSNISENSAVTPFGVIDKMLFDKNDMNGTGRIAFGYTINPPVMTPLYLQPFYNSDFSFYAYACLK